MDNKVMDGKVRCSWVTADPLYITYHDQEWGVPCRDEQKLFEMLLLEGLQAGLSWITVLRKRDRYRQVTGDFCAEKLAAWSDEEIEAALQDKDLIRNRRKMEALRQNARAFLALRQRCDVVEWLWQFTGDTTLRNHWDSGTGIPAATEESHAMSRELKRAGFTFVGPTICYAFMQAVGMVNDHSGDCFLRLQF